MCIYICKKLIAITSLTHTTRTLRNYHPLVVASVPPVCARGHRLPCNPTACALWHWHSSPNHHEFVCFLLQCTQADLQVLGSTSQFNREGGACCHPPRLQPRPLFHQHVLSATPSQCCCHCQANSWEWHCHALHQWPSTRTSLVASPCHRKANSQADNPSRGICILPSPLLDWSVPSCSRTLPPSQ